MKTILLIIVLAASCFAQEFRTDENGFLVLKQENYSPPVPEKQTGLLRGESGLKFNGLYCGINTVHNATDQLWQGYSRNFILTAAASWGYFNFTAQGGVPIYRVGGAAKKTYIQIGLELKLL